jgi:hypothetical protein
MTANSELERFGILPNDRPSGRLELELRCLVRVFRLVLGELRLKQSLPWKQRLGAWKSGFRAHSWGVYNLAENDPDMYVSDLRIQLKMYKINGFSTPIVGNKLVLSRLLAYHEIPHPGVVSTIQGGRLFEDNRPFDADMARALSRTLDRYPRQVFRPSWAGGGQGVFFLSRDDEGLKLNGQEVAPDAIHALLAKLDRYVSTEFIQQASYARVIYPGTTNTLRILSLWDEENGGPFIAAAVHRFGSPRSGAVDNFHAGHGGLCAPVDLEAGTLGKAATLTPEGEWLSASSHPDTGAPIEGVVLPGFSHCIEVVLKAASHFPFCPCIGWDVVLTDNGFSILEANTLPSLTVMQVHRPLLTDPRTRRFFQRWGMVPVKPGTG